MRYGSKNRIVRTLESFSVDKSSATCSLRCMEPTSDSRFDPNYALQMLLDAAQELSLEKLLKKFVTRAVGRPDVAFAQIWMVEKADGCLHLAVAGGSVPPQLSESADPIPVGTGILGQVAATGQRIARRIGDPDWKQLADPAWLNRERIEAFVVLPITFKDEILGVITGFLRHAMLAESLPYGEMFGTYLGAAVANARAFEEIQRLKTRLEQQNAYLEEEVLEARAFGDLIGQSSALGQIISQIDLVAPTEASVLIRAKPALARNSSRAKSIVAASARTSRWFALIAPPFPKSFSKANFSDTSAAHSPALSKTAPGVLKLQKAARCFWMKSVKCLWKCRANFYACSRRNAMSAWATIARDRRTSASSPRRIAS